MAAAAGSKAEPGSSQYHVSSSGGDDSAAGTSPETAWRTLARASAHNFAPGDALLLKAGDRFSGQLAVESSGRPGQPLRIARYGAGPKPVIDGAAEGGGGFSEAILIRNQQHIEISDLALTNTLDRPRAGKRGDWSFGIHVINDGAGVLEHFRFERITITNVFAAQLDHASEDAFNLVAVSGIRFVVEASPAGAQPAFFRDIVIAQNDISRTGRFGVQIGHAGGGDAHTRDPETGFNRDIIIKDNRFTELGGTAVQLAGARFALIENNDFDRTGSSVVPSRMVGRGSGAWVINSRDIVAQRNRSRHVRGHKDSYGLHVDYGNRDVLYQYNLSYDSEGGFVEILGNNRNIIWRYNISINDGLREKDGNTIWLSPWSTNMTPSEGIHIYNNTIYVRAGMYPDLDFRARGVRIWNNIFAVSRHAMIGEKYRAVLDGGRLEMGGNLFFGRISPKLRGLDANSIESDPQFANPGADHPEGYVIAASSPAAASGVSWPHPDFPAAGQGVFAQISERPKTDFFGQPLPQYVVPTVGAVLPAH
jgi:hypothetical protein